jgi:hypothetical protein
MFPLDDGVDTSPDRDLRIVVGNKVLDPPPATGTSTKVLF